MPGKPQGRRLARQHLIKRECILRSVCVLIQSGRHIVAATQESSATKARTPLYDYPTFL